MWLIEKLADLHSERDQAKARGEDTAAFDGFIEAVEEELAATGVRGHADPSSKLSGLRWS